MTGSASPYSQHDFDLRLEWAERGIEAICDGAAVAVIVDVLSFSTGVAIGTARGAHIHPWRVRGESAALEAERLGAFLAVPRAEVSSAQPYSLSPPSLATLEAGAHLVLPSPNGATLSLLAAERAPHVLAGCLRNASAVARAALRCAEGRSDRAHPGGRALARR